MIFLKRSLVFLFLYDYYFSINSTFCVSKPQPPPRRSMMPKLEDFDFSDDFRSQLMRDMELSGKYSGRPPVVPAINFPHGSKAEDTPSVQILDGPLHPFGSASCIKVSPGMFGRTEAIKSPEAGRATSKAVFYFTILSFFMDLRAILCKNLPEKKGIVRDNNIALLVRTYIISWA